MNVGDIGGVKCVNDGAVTRSGQILEISRNDDSIG